MCKLIIFPYNNFDLNALNLFCIWWPSQKEEKLVTNMLGIAIQLKRTCPYQKNMSANLVWIQSKTAFKTLLITQN